jgi:diguanylate cyclase (GGDEF)-like protein
MVVAPLLLMFIAGPRPHWSPRKLLEAVLSAICLWLIGLTVFGEISLSQAKNYPLEFLCIPFLIWVAFRFSQCEAAMAVATLSGIAIWGTLHGFGPFVRSSANESLLLLQAFMGVVGVMTIAVAAVVSERKRVEEELRSARDRLERQAASDPLTGLANYRRLVEVYTAEVERSDRTGRPFALLLFDLDGLKKINDTRGHLVGSRALCRVADVLRLYCRSIDTAARYGGDEFAVLLPETGAGGAQYVAGRIVERVARDKEAPSISVSVGIAVHPDDGKTIEEVFETADAALYSMKNAAGKKRGR